MKTLLDSSWVNDSAIQANHQICLCVNRRSEQDTVLNSCGNIQHIYCKISNNHHCMNNSDTEMMSMICFWCIQLPFEVCKHHLTQFQLLLEFAATQFGSTYPQCYKVKKKV
jgi:hypothetical protein